MSDHSLIAPSETDTKGSIIQGNTVTRSLAGTKAVNLLLMKMKQKLVGGRVGDTTDRSSQEAEFFDAAANRSIEIDTLMSGCDLPVNIRQRGNGRDPKVGGTVTSDAILNSVSRLLTARGGIKSGTNRGHPSRLAFFPIQLAMC